MKDEELKAYIETGEPFDKAGGYGIQVRRVAAGDAQQELRFKQE
jgi:predicted house-cleaning NTP pyrophosphatase (Maf/HAM1 superfamily)